MSKHEGIIVATDETDHIAFFCPKCDKAMSVLRVSTSETDGLMTDKSVTHIYLKCSGCGYDHWRKFDWAGKTAQICQHRTDRSEPQSHKGTKELNGVQLIAAERTRQVADEKYSADHDDEHANNELLAAAVCYLDEAAAYPIGTDFADWPFEEGSFKSEAHDPVRNLVKAGALIAAEIDRMQRLIAKGGRS